MIIVYTIILMIIIFAYWYITKDVSEHFEDYGSVNKNRYDYCDIYIDTFANTYRTAPNIVNQRFGQWCKSYESYFGIFPRYRKAEIAYKRLFHKYDN